MTHSQKNKFDSHFETGYSAWNLLCLNKFVSQNQDLADPMPSINSVNCHRNEPLF
jgi:hypothetical protein